jgi:hypothetical protein
MGLVVGCKTATLILEHWALVALKFPRFRKNPYCVGRSLG